MAAPRAAAVQQPIKKQLRQNFEDWDHRKIRICARPRLPNNAYVETSMNASAFVSKRARSRV